MLGNTVMGLKKTNDMGVVVKTPTWNLILNYNQQILNKVAVLMNEALPKTCGRPLIPTPVLVIGKSSPPSNGWEPTPPWVG